MVRNGFALGHIPGPWPGFKLGPRLALVVPALLVASVAQAQEQNGERLFRLRGEVRDFVTEQPIPGAVVQIAELARSVVTDANGYFEFSALTANEYTFVTASFGYETNREPSAVGPGNIMLVRLRPIPVTLPGITVEVERLLEQLETRRLVTASPATVFEQQQMVLSIAPSLTSFVREHTAALDIFSNANDQLCTTLTPGSSPVRLRVVLDEAPVPTAFLDNLQPRDVAMVEVFERLAMVRIYTKNFLDRAADAGYSPQPINLMERPQLCS